jgi:hypothetical protein
MSADIEALSEEEFLQKTAQGDLSGFIVGCQQEPA